MPDFQQSLDRTALIDKNCPMPELPEVETIVRDLRRKVINLTVQDITIHDARVIRGQIPKHFIQDLKARRLKRISRRGKAIVIELDNGRYFVVQLMMTGQLIHSKDSQRTKATKVSIRLSDNQYLNYNDHRLFGRLQIVDSLEAIPYFGKLGPEPLTAQFSVAWLRKQIRTRKVPIKSLLMDHTFVAGIGNIYASEILFESDIDPRRPAQGLKTAEIQKLNQATKKILKEAIRWRGTSMNTYRDANGEKGGFMRRIKVYGRENETCRECAALVAKIVQRGRSTFYCPQCQH